MVVGLPLSLTLLCTLLAPQEPESQEPQPPEQQQPETPAQQEPVPPPVKTFVEPYPDQDMLSYDLDLKVDVGAEKLMGTVRYRVHAKAELPAIELDARHGPDYDVTFTDADGTPIDAEWDESVQRVRLFLPQPVKAGDDVTFTATLSGQPLDGFYFASSRYGDPMAFTDAYSIRAHGWLPCEDHPADRASWSVALTYPDGMKAVATGVPETPTTTPPSGWQAWRSHSTSDIPPYMFAIVIGKFTAVQEEGDPRLVPHLIYEQDAAKARKTLTHDAEWLHAMESTFGDYAFGKYMVVQCPTRWGGFEAPGNVQISERLFDGRSSGTGTLAHELVHMWFGDAVGYATWSEVWLSEGFASYFGPWLEEKTGGPSLTDSLQEMRSRWLRSREGATKPVRWRGFAHPDQALNANTYPKGAWVLHMLRSELGDDTFFKALRTYYERFRGTSVTTEDFVAVVQEVSGQDLAWFFSQWLDRPDSPRLRVSTKDGAIVVEQMLRPLFKFHLRLAWRDAAGQPHDEVTLIEQQRTEIPVDGTPQDLVVDPKTELLWREVR